MTFGIVLRLHALVGRHREDPVVPGLGGLAAVFDGDGAEHERHLGARHQGLGPGAGARIAAHGHRRAGLRPEDDIRLAGRGHERGLLERLENRGRTRRIPLHLLRDVGLHEGDVGEPALVRSPIKRLHHRKHRAEHEHHERGDELRAPAAQTLLRLAEQPPAVCREGEIEENQDERHAVGAGIGRHLEQTVALPLAGRERQPGKPAEQPRARPLHQHPRGGQARQRRDAQRGRPADDPRHRPPDCQVPHADPRPDDRPEQKETDPRHRVQPPEQRDPRRRLRREQRARVEFQRWTPIGPKDRRHGERVGELGHLVRREHQDRHHRGQHPHARGPDPVRVALPPPWRPVIRIGGRRGHLGVRLHRSWRRDALVALPGRIAAGAPRLQDVFWWKFPF